MPTYFGFERHKSTSPESRTPEVENPSDRVDQFSAISLTTNDGRPISREEVIERLKRGESPTWTLRCNLKNSATPPKDIPTNNASPKLQPSPEFVETVLEVHDEIKEPESSRSALHSGDFWQGESPSASPYSISPPAPWSSSFPAQWSSSPPAAWSSNRRSSILSNSFLPPTTPLVNSLSNADLDDPFLGHFDPDSRRNSFSAHYFQTSRTVMGSPRTSSHQYQAHQPQRSIPIPQTPRIRPRGMSVSSEHSPLHHAPLVGSYEESILLGRMSTKPSKPLNFIAQIGVLGKGKCKPSLRCPPHTSVSFPAVFYSYGSTGPRIENEPSPYVGLIDVEHTFPTHDSRSPPGGCYRIPQVGQLQFIIKTPNKTAVKLFLVPYDLSDMEPGSKTFIRQRSYSTGPVVETPISASIDGPIVKDTKADKPVLRYLIHLNICCTARGRYYLYKSIRVVFANRVPDGKEKLRNEISFPDPKYTVYKPNGHHTTPSSTMAVAMRNSSTLKDRRRSTPFSFHMPGLDQADGIDMTGMPRRQPLTSASTLIRPLGLGLGGIMQDTELSKLTEEDRTINGERMEL
jgi:hypothetical protein